LLTKHEFKMIFYILDG